MREAVHAFKFGGRTDVGRALARMAGGRSVKCSGGRNRRHRAGPGDGKAAQGAGLQPVFHRSGGALPRPWRTRRLRDARQGKADGRPVHALEEKQEKEHPGGVLRYATPRGPAPPRSGRPLYYGSIPRGRRAGHFYAQGREPYTFSPSPERLDEKSAYHTARGARRGRRACRLRLALPAEAGLRHARKGGRRQVEAQKASVGFHGGLLVFKLDGDKDKGQDIAGP